MQSFSDKEEFIFKDDLQWVKPYWRTHYIPFKPKWKGKSIRDAVEQSFPHLSKKQIDFSIQQGHVYNLNGSFDENRMLARTDRIVFKQHKHEPPVISQSFKTLFEDDDFLVLNKPATLPSVSSGPYYRNTLLYMATAILRFSPFTVNRLDRLTSGLFILGKSKQFVHKYQQLLSSGKVKKYYLARVWGKFPPPIRISEPIGSSRAFSDCEIKKPSESLFRGLDYCSETESSLVLCQPITGRTHQLRIHLAHMGHPIVNDHLYGRIPIDSHHFRDIDYSRAPDFDHRELSCWTCSHLADTSLWTKSAFHNGLWLHSWKCVLDDNVYIAPAPSWSDNFLFDLNETIGDL